MLTCFICNEAPARATTANAQVGEQGNRSAETTTTHGGSQANGSAGTATTQGGSQAIGSAGTATTQGGSQANGSAGTATIQGGSQENGTAVGNSGETETNGSINDSTDGDANGGPDREVMGTVAGAANITNTVINLQNGLSSMITSDSDVTGCEEVGEKFVDAMLTEAVLETFRFKPFIVLESELEKESLAAMQFFKKMDLSIIMDRDVEEKNRLWVDLGNKEEFRTRHMRKRNNVNQNVARTMESK